MKNLVKSALVVGVLSQAAGCIFVTDDTADGTGSIDATWNLVDTYPEDGNTPGCEGAGAATIYASATGSNLEPEYWDTFDCITGRGTMMDVPLGSYDVWVDITLDGEGTQLYAQSEIAENVNLSTDGEVRSAIFTIEIVNGFFDVQWQLDGGATSCAQVPGENGVAILATVADTTEALDIKYDCEDGVGTTDALPLAEYVIDLDVIDATTPVPLSLGSSASISGVSLDYGHQFVDLGLVNIIVD